MRLKSHLLRADKQIPQHSVCKLFQYRKNARANNQEVLLVNTIKRHENLYKGLQYFLSFKVSLT